MARNILLNDPRVRFPENNPIIVENICKVLDVYDGDTVHVSALLGAPTQPVKLSVRLAGIDTPEIKTKNRVEHEHGVIAREELKKLAPVGSILTCGPAEYDKYGRVLCNLFTESGVNLSQWMLEKKYARVYDGGKKEEWKWDTAPSAP
jgi:micrococcal nuclease